ncbi:MAG: NADPH-dependent F420 reductase [Chloroflexales bacterium]|nr:NADPH-dependent F420 reductase [Chloroflexales bacterium]
MDIGIIGAGNVGATLARLFDQAGHRVAISNSRGAESLAALVASLGPQVQALAAEDAVRFGQLVLLALPWRTRDQLPDAALFADKIVLDATNPYNATGGLYDLGDSTSSEAIAAQLTNARIVKAFNTIYYQHLASRGQLAAPPNERHAIFLAGDDDDAKAVVARLITDIGFAPVDTGTLREGGRRQQPGTPIYNVPMTGADARRRLADAVHE